MLVKLLFLLLASRVLIDVIYFDAKPLVIVAMHAVFVTLVSFVMIIKSGKIAWKKNIIIILLFAGALSFSLIKSDVDPIKHLNFSLQVFVPVLFLLACTSKPFLVQRASILFRKIFAVPAIILISIFCFFDYRNNNLLGLGFFDYYANNPHHGIAQTAMKISMLFFADGFVMTFFAFILLGIINVRSTIISFVISYAVYVRKMFLQNIFSRKILFSLFLILFLVIFFVDFEGVIGRFLFKNRDSDQFGSSGSNVSSGRTEIYAYYINYIYEKFGIFDWLFGQGPIWLRSYEMELSAHNDILNLLVSYGIVGLIIVIFSYYRFFASLHPKIRLTGISAFLILFLANGVVFHQSTILFALLYFYGNHKAIGSS